MGVTPLKLIILYNNCDEYTPEELCCQTISSSSSLKLMDEARLTTSFHRLYNLTSTHLRNVQLRSCPSHNSTTDLFCSLTIQYNSQYWMVKLDKPSQTSFQNLTLVPFLTLTIQYNSQYWMIKLDEPRQTSSQNLTLVPFPIFHLYPILATFAAQSTPF
jgi:hypothetical protein